MTCASLTLSALLDLELLGLDDSIEPLRELYEVPTDERFSFLNKFPFFLGREMGSRSRAVALPSHFVLFPDMTDTELLWPATLKTNIDEIRQC